MSLSISTKVREYLLWVRYLGGVYLLEGEANCTWIKKIQVMNYVLKKYSKRIESNRGGEEEEVVEVELAERMGREVPPGACGQRARRCRQLALHLSQGTAFQGEGTAFAKARRQEQAQRVRETVGGASWLEQNGPAGEGDWKGIGRYRIAMGLDQRPGVRV